MTVKPLRVLVGATAIAVVAALASCTSGPQEATGPTTLKVRVDGGMTSMDPFANVGTSAWQMLRQVYEGLLSLDDEGNPIPMLAESWTVSDDGLVYEFALREDVTFHNDQPMTAADVVYSLNYYRENALRASQLSYVTDVSAVDDHTVKVVLNKPVGSFLTQLGGPIPVPIVPDGSAENEALNREEFGTGPFKVVEFVNETRVVLEAFEDYVPVDEPATIFGGHKEALVDRIEMFSVVESQTAIAGLETGQYDVVDAVPTEQIDRVMGMDGVELLQAPGSSTVALYINAGEAGVPDEGVRAAIVTAIDKEQLLETTADGFGAVTNSYVPSIAGWFVPELQDEWPWTGGASQAEELLEASGYDGAPIEIIASSFDFMRSNAVLISQQLEAVGIATSIVNLDHTTYLNRLRAGEFQLASTGRSADIPVDNTYAMWYCAYGEAPTRFGYCNDEYDAAFDAAVTTADPDARNRAFAELDVHLKDAALSMPLYFDNVVLAVDDSVEGLEPHPFGWLNLWNVSIQG